MQKSMVAAPPSNKCRSKRFKGAVSRGILPFLNKTKLKYLLIYLQNNIKTSREKNPPSFERETNYGLF